MESVLYHCEAKPRRQFSFLPSPGGARDVGTLAALLSLAYQELYVPILNGSIETVMEQKDALASFQSKHRFGYGTVDPNVVKKMTDEEIMVNFLKTIPVYQAPFLAMPFTLCGDELSPLVTHGKAFFEYMPDYRKTWVTTSLKFAYDSIRDLRVWGKVLAWISSPTKAPVLHSSCCSSSTKSIWTLILLGTHRHSVIQHRLFLMWNPSERT